MPEIIRSVTSEAGGILLTLLLGLPAHAARKHFIWAAKDDDSTVYIAGAIHGLFRDDSALPEAYSSILDASERLVLETDFEALASDESLGYWAEQASRADSIEIPSNLLRQAQLQLLNHGIIPFGHKAPWSLAVTIEDLRSKDVGIDFELGVDLRLFNRAQAAEKQIIGLEDFRQHIDVLPSVPVAEQIVWLESALDASRDMKDEWMTQIALWRSGDLEGLAALDSPESPGYSQVIASRNQNWLPLIAALLDRPGVSFVVIGASHLGRKDGILAGLRQRGFELVQVEDPALSIERDKEGLVSVHSNPHTGTVWLESSTDLRVWTRSDNTTVADKNTPIFWRAVWQP